MASFFVPMRLCSFSNLYAVERWTSSGRVSVAQKQQADQDESPVAEK